VQVVDLDDAGLGGHRAPDRVGVEALRCALEQHAPGLAQQPPARVQHERRDEQRRDAVRAVEAGDHHDRARCGGPQRRVQVGKHVLPGALHVEALPLGAAERPRGRDVDHRAGEADRDDEDAVDVGRIEQPADRLDRDDPGEDEQRRAVDLRGQDLGPSEPEREPPGRRARRQPHGDQRQGDRAGVGEHVRGVGEQRQRRRQQAADDLENHEAGDERQRQPEPAQVGVGRRRVVVMVSTVVVPVLVPVGPVVPGRHGRYQH
jgi:hypothetical protein